MRRGFLARRLRDLGGDGSAVAAVEFALIVPVLLTMTIGTIEVGRFALYSRKMNLVASTMGQLVSQSSKDFTSGDVHFTYDSAIVTFPQVLTEARARGANWWDVIRPTFSSVVFKPKSPGCTENCEYDAYVAWTAGNVRRPCGKLSKSNDASVPSYSALPASMYGESSVIAVDVVMNYRPMIFLEFMPEITLHRSSYFVPRYVSQVNYTSQSSSQYFVTKCPGV